MGGCSLNPGQEGKRTWLHGHRKVMARGLRLKLHPLSRPWWESEVQLPRNYDSLRFAIFPGLGHFLCGFCSSIMTAGKTEITQQVGNVGYMESPQTALVTRLLLACCSREVRVSCALSFLHFSAPHLCPLLCLKAFPQNFYL